jgi:IS5 family transposase
MIRYQSSKQIVPEEFKTDFELRLAPDNRWVRLSRQLPWDELIRPYVSKMKSDKGAQAINPRVIVGSLFIKHKLNLSDEETIRTIQENPYMQFFMGLNEYHPEPLFDASLFVTIRKRMGKNEFEQMDKAIVQAAQGGSQHDKPVAKSNRNKGEMKIDATVADQYIKYPTDLDLINQCREWTQEIIDEIFPKTFLDKKPRTYRRVARTDYLKVAKKKHKTTKEIRRGIRKQLQYVRRNIGYIDELLDMFEQGQFPLCRKSQHYLWVLQEVYRQQKYMYDNKTHTCEDRIVSLHQPHVRPIKRGKASADVEFGSKLSMSLSGGFARVDRLSWNNFNECTDLQAQVETYKNSNGHYPDLLLADKIYFTRENRRWLDERSIRYTASPLGRPKEETAYARRKKKKEAARRNHIEGKFGQAKNGYNMDQIRARLKDTSESMVCCIVFVMNVTNFYSKKC